VRLTIVGSGPAAPQPDTPASGILIEAIRTTVLFDCGSGVIARLRTLADPGALGGVVIGHLHADHFIDLAALRYLYPWPGTNVGRPVIWLPPGGAARMASLAALISERPAFFDDAFDIREYATGRLFEVGDLAIRPEPMQHYVPAWAMRIEDPAGGTIVYGGDSGPSDALVRIATGADLLVAEATLGDALDDEPRRGHSTGQESIGLARRAGVPRLVLTHYPSALRPALNEVADAAPDIHVEVGRPGLVVDLGDQPGAAVGGASVGGASEPGNAVPDAGADAGDAGSNDSMRARRAAASGSAPSNPSAVRQ
jgi:ribonuclease BN (tRNA processing enzyme)